MMKRGALKNGAKYNNFYIKLLQLQHTTEVMKRMDLLTWQVTLDLVKSLLVDKQKAGKLGIRKPCHGGAN